MLQLPEQPSSIRNITSLIEPISRNEFDVVSITDSSPTIPLPQVPEIIIHILEYVPQTPSEYFIFGQVSVQFYLAAHTFFDLSKVAFNNYNNDWNYEHLSLQLWKNMVLKAWPNFGTFSFLFSNNVDPNANIQNWVKVYKRRNKVQNTLTWDEHLIDDCSRMTFKCPLKFEALQETEDENQRFCNKCEKIVYHCDSQEELDMRRKNKECVSFFVRINELQEIDDWMGGDMDELTDNDYIEDDPISPTNSLDDY
jgi:Txe/YoeB family toxin of Txe-Axe toxin-antitoxin module